MIPPQLPPPLLSLLPTTTTVFSIHSLQQPRARTHATPTQQRVHVVMPQREVVNKAAGGGGGRPGGHAAQQVDVEVGGGERSAGAGRAAWAAAAGVGLAGAAVLVWWAVAFHLAHQQLWMVPVGLVLLGTPLVAWLSLFASGAGRWLGRLRAADQRPPAVAAPAVAPER